MDVQGGLSHQVCGYAECPNCGQAGFIPFGIKMLCQCGALPRVHGNVYVESRNGTVLPIPIPEFVWTGGKVEN